MRGFARIGVIAAAAALLLTPQYAGAVAPDSALADLEDEVMCTVCGTTLELANSPQADQERELIRALAAQGRSKDEIKDALVAEYGADVLATPAGEGFDLAAWLVPIAGLLAGLVGVAAIAVRRSRRSQPPTPESPIADADAARLRDDMSRYEL